MFALLVTAFAFFTPSMRLPSGGSIRLLGSGPPCVFSSGLWNTAPNFLYSNVLRGLKKNMTVVTASMPLDAAVIDEIADTIGVDQVVLFGHSSFDPRVLASDRIRRAVLCDPISRPLLDLTGMQQTSVDAACPVLTLRASYLYNSSMPQWNVPDIRGDVKDKVLDGYGHTDILDDRWAEFANGLGFWRAAQPQKQRFDEWLPSESGSSGRLEYREALVSHALIFLLAQ